MVRKKSLTAFAASALLLSGAGSAWAAMTKMPVRGAGRGGVPARPTSIQSSGTTTPRSTSSVEADGTITLNVVVDARRRPSSQGHGLHDRRRRSRTPRQDPDGASARRSSTRRALAADLARERLPQGRCQAQRQVRRPDPGRHGHPAREHLHRRAAPRRPRASSTSRRTTSRPRSRRHQHGDRPDPVALFTRAPTASTATAGHRRSLHRHRPDA